jgi:predicted GIY-YIG superfamily endonuclease
MSVIQKNSRFDSHSTIMADLDRRNLVFPGILLYHEEYLTRSEAMKREKQIKSMKSREYIHQLIKKKR